jgi:hypothetical protein
MAALLPSLIMDYAAQLLVKQILFTDSLLLLLLLVVLCCLFAGWVRCVFTAAPC